MKALICTGCMDVRGLPNTGDLSRWIGCYCGNARARWTDADAGRVEVAARDRERVRILGMNNHFLVRAAAGSPTNEQRRSLHAEATDAPHHIFDGSRAACWAVVFRVGETNDVRWEGEMDERLRERVEALRPGDDVTLVDVSGARFSGTVMERKPENPGDEVALRRAGGGVHFVKHDRIREVE